MSVWPVITNQGSSDRVWSVTISEMCSGVCPGVCRTSIETLPNFENFAVSNAAEWKRRVCIGEQYVLSTGGLGQFAARRNVIGMQMGVDDIKDAHSGFVGRFQIGTDIANGIDNGRGRTSSAAKEVGRRDRISVQVLAQDHGGPPLFARETVG